jgi:hypothetical protein
LLRLTQSVPLSRGEGEDDFSRLYATDVYLGGGVEWKDLSGIYVRPSVNLSYTHVRKRYDYNSALTQQFLRPYDAEVFNTRIDVITYSPNLEIGYRHAISDIAVSLKSKYAHLWNRSFSSSSDLIDIDSATGLLKNEIGALFPLGNLAESLPLSLNTTLARGDLYQTARAALGFSYFHELGVGLLFDLRKIVSVVDSIQINTSYTVADDFYGINGGVQVRF